MNHLKQKGERERERKRDNKKKERKVRPSNQREREYIVIRMKKVSYYQHKCNTTNLTMQKRTTKVDLF